MNDTDWFEGRSADVRPIDYNPWWLKALIEILCFACLGVILALGIREARADPVFQATGEGVLITLYDEKCSLTEQVSNLPYRATWTEKGHTFEGCFGAQPSAGVVVFYFDDKTVGLIPFEALKKVTNA